VPLAFPKHAAGIFGKSRREETAPSWLPSALRKKGGTIFRYHMYERRAHEEKTATNKRTRKERGTVYLVASRHCFLPRGRFSISKGEGAQIKKKESS